MNPRMAMEQDTHPHVHLWQTASFLLDSAEKDEDSSNYLLLASLLTSYLAYEGFVNSCGFILLPDLWVAERENFRGVGIEGKLEAITAKLGDHFTWDKGDPRYREIKKLEKFRHMVVHAKALTKRYEAERTEDGSEFRFEHEWDSFIAIDKVKQSREKIESFCQSIVEAASKISDHPRLTFDAFEGSGLMTTGKSIPDQPAS